MSLEYIMLCSGIKNSRRFAIFATLIVAENKLTLVQKPE